MPRPFDRTPAAQDNYRVNQRIRVPEVRVIGGEDGKTQLGIMPTHEALRLAEEAGFDLVEVSPKSMPPVCRIMDYGKFKYEQSKQKAKAKKHATDIIVKEVKFRPKTDDHDFDFKVKHIRRFIGEGNKAKLVIVFRGREIVHPETGQDMLRAVYEACQDVAMIEQAPMMEGRRMLMMLAPRPPGSRPQAMPALATPPPPPPPPPTSSGGAGSSGPRPSAPSSSAGPSASSVPRVNPAPTRAPGGPDK